MKKTKKLQLSRETLRHLAAPAALQGAAGGATVPLTGCALSICADTCTVRCPSQVIDCTE
jgi:hypothetical protein